MECNGVRSSKLACGMVWIGNSEAIEDRVGGALYHVTSRGDRREAIYEDDQDRRALLTFLGDVVERFNGACYAYCLMEPLGFTLRQ
jgi:hypothetical protein